MMEHHGGPFRGPISGGLPGILVGAFSIFVMGGALFIWANTYFFLWIGAIVVALSIVWLRSR